MSLVYLDSVILIYLLDHQGPLQVEAERRLKEIHDGGDGVVVSDLTRLECRVKPIERGDRPLLDAFDGFFGLPDIPIVPLTRAVLDRATEIRAGHRFKTMDAIHLAAAVESGALCS